MISIPSPPSDLVILISCSLPCLVSVFIVAYAVSSLRYHCKLLELKILEKESLNSMGAQPLASADGMDEPLQEAIGLADPNDHVAVTASDSASEAGSAPVQTGSEVEQEWSQEESSDIQSEKDSATAYLHSNPQEQDTDLTLTSSEIKDLVKNHRWLQIYRMKLEDKMSELTLDLLKCRRRLDKATSGLPDAVSPDQTKEELLVICAKQELKIMELIDRLSEYHHRLATGGSSDSTTFLPPSPPYVECSCKNRDDRYSQSAPVTMIDAMHDRDSEIQKGGECEEGQSSQGSQCDREVQRNEKDEEIQTIDEDEYAGNIHKGDDEANSPESGVPDSQVLAVGE